MAILAGKKAIIIGDRDGIPGPAIAECVQSAGGEVIFSSTECFVLTSAGAMDLENQKRRRILPVSLENRDWGRGKMNFTPSPIASAYL